MKHVMLIQHESFEPLGTLNPVLKKEGVRIRYVNFERHPDAKPSIDKYDGLILMGGYMGVYESHKYEHLKVEMKLIERALAKKIPILGICLGSQILAHVLGSDVKKHTEREMGWYQIHLTEEGQRDPVLNHFNKSEMLFQSHGDTFDIPLSATQLAWSEKCKGQAFKYGENVYGFQFHLEIDLQTIHHWIAMPENIEIFKNSNNQFIPKKILDDTENYLTRSVELSTFAFYNFLQIAGPKKRFIHLKSGH